MSTLYRKYRPQKFEDLVGQEHLIQTLTNEISAGRIAHAYLFSGPRGIGKTTMARLLAKAVNCENYKAGSFEPCDECSSCKEISAARNIDVLEIDAASNTGVDNVKENIIENAQFKPTKSKYKVFIIDEVHMLSTSAFNALLKTLEEPPAHVIFVLATTELHKLPATIISRCQRFNFKKISEEVMLKKLEGIAKAEEVKIDKEVYKRVIAKSDGCMRDAESLLGQILSLNLKKITPEDAALILPSADIEAVIEYLEAIINNHVETAIEIIDNMVKAGASLEQFALNVIEVLRAVMIAGSGQLSFGADYTDKDKKRIKALSAQIDKNTLIRLIDSAIRRRSEIKMAPVPQLPLELLAVDFSANNDNRDKPAPPKALAADPTPSPQPGQPAKTKPTSDETPSDAVLPEPVVTRTDGDSLSIADLAAKWPTLINKLSEICPSMIFVLKMADICSVEGNTIGLSVPYSFHKEKLEDKKTKKIIDENLSEILGRNVCICCKVNEQKNISSCDADITGLAAEFGGEVIA